MQRIVRLVPASGFTLIELIIVLILIGIVASVATRNMSTAISTSQVEQTKAELEQLSLAIVGDPSTYSSGTQANFGYIGDVGSLPPNLDALVSNPGGYSTWSGPYIESDGGTGYKYDGWGSAYTLGTTSISSSGNGSILSKSFANSSAALTSNTVAGIVLDAGQQVPGTTFKDSVVVRIVKPDGSGSTTVVAANPTASGQFTLSAIPIGRRTLEVIFLPSTDTFRLPITVYPGRSVQLEIVFPADIF